MKLSNKTVERVCRVFGYLKVLEDKGIAFVSSLDLAKAIGATESTVRKDISILELTGFSRKGYDVMLLKKELGVKLQLNKKRKACIVGLGRLGTALLDYEKFQEDGFEIVAGFDASINKIERINTVIDVFAVDDLENVVAQRKIELGIIAVPAQAAQGIAYKLVKSGVKGVLNFSPVKLIVPKNVMYLDMDFTSALRSIAARMAVC
ncbi:MAG: redox-sensing transcriptional repressor Rex [Candidatus Omnitrophica bacterium]|nr:redox-sensing transcriptional repressor Rex [Candidatus Omnitrophota bacterium]